LVIAIIIKLLKNYNIQVIIGIIGFFLISLLFIDYSVDYHTKKSPPPGMGEIVTTEVNFTAKKCIKYNVEYINETEKMVLHLDESVTENCINP